MERRESKGDGNLLFAVNGERFELPSVDPSTTLLEFLRTETRFKSVKLGCGEGGCGACVVLLSKYDPLVDQVEDCTVSSCLTLLCSINGCSITTTEGLGNSKDGLHPIHQRFAGFHASQCGFCTPGICMSLFSALVNAEKTDRPEPPSGFSKLSVSEAEKAVAGNLCRCTGYRPVADACKSFAADVDIEDLGFNSFWEKEESKDVKESRLPPYDLNKQICTFPEFLKKKTKDSMPLSPERYSWHSPHTIEELQYLLNLEEAENGARVKLVVSNTGTGYYKELEPYDKYIDMRHIPELSATKKDISGIQIGAAVSISKAISFLREGNGNALDDGTKMVHIKLANHLEKIASGFIRNSASVGGNLVMAQRNHFPSDIATLLLAVDAIVDVIYGSKRERIPFEKFLHSPPLDHRSVLLSVNIPNWSDDSNLGKGSKLMFETYRAAPRPLGNALPYLNAALFAEVIPHEYSNSITIRKVRLAFGAYGNKHAIRVRKAEDFLIGTTLNPDILYQAIELIKATFLLEHNIPDLSYRSSLAVAFLFEFLHPLIQTGQQISDGSLNGCIGSLVPWMNDVNTQSDTIDHSSLLLPSKQQIGSSNEYYPVGEPVKKTGAALQASGEAVYVDDIPSPTNCLHGSFIYSTKPLAWVKGIRFQSDLHPGGVTGIVSFNDIPNGGENIGSNSVFGPEPLFADEMTRCAGQRIAVVVADTQKHADVASKLAVVDYDTQNLEQPILTVEDAVEKGSFFETPEFLRPKPVGDFSKGMAEADHKFSAEIRLPSQYYFYMETQVALAVPDEDNCIVVYSALQCPEWTHSVIARCLGVPEHNVRVITRRVGGGFGGKAMRAMPVATACALAAHVLRHPVRMYLDRKTDMIMAGGRHPMKVTFSVGFKSDGKITALHLDVLINAGMTEDISPIMPSNMLGPLKKYDWGALSFVMKVCRTNHTSKSAMRAPGEVQGSYIAEAVIEYVACSLSMEVDAIRSKNLHLFDSLSFFYGDSAGEPHEYTLPSIWDKLAKSSCLNERVEMVKQFNRSHKWQKKGISRVPVVHEVMVRPTPGKVSILWDGSIVVEIGGIELGQGLWTKVKQMAAYGLSLIGCAGSENLLEKVRVIQADTLSLVQGGFTAGSTTSEASCEAASICCRTLVERLTPLKERLQKQNASVDWQTLITQAQWQAVNLSASAFYVPDATSMRYLNYGAAVSEVEVNLLTGETTILRSDIIYDCGQSLNPAVDLGQIEGAFVQGIGFFMLEEYSTNSDGLVIANGTWTYKIPTIDTVPKQINVEILNSGHHQKRVLSSKASGEPPLVLACSVHCAARAAVKEARKQILAWRDEAEDTMFQLDVPATMPVVKELCGLDIVEVYLKSSLKAAIK